MFLVRRDLSVDWKSASFQAPPPPRTLILAVVFLLVLMPAVAVALEALSQYCALSVMAEMLEESETMWLVVAAAAVSSLRS